MAFNSSHLTFCLANLLTFYLAFCLGFSLAFYLAYLLAFYLSYLLTFYLAYLAYPACLLTFYLAYLCGIPPGMSMWHSIWHVFWHSIWHIFWHSIWHSFWHSVCHIFWHSIWHIFWHSIWHIFWHSIWHIFWHSIRHSIWHSLWHSIWLRFWPLRSGWGPEAHGAQNLAGWGPARPTVLRLSPVEVRRGPLRSRAGSGGPARPTAIKSWQMRSGEAHCDQELADEIWQGSLRSRAGRWGPARKKEEEGGRRKKEGRRRSRATNIKSNNTPGRWGITIPRCLLFPRWFLHWPEARPRMHAAAAPHRTGRASAAGWEFPSCAVEIHGKLRGNECYGKWMEI